MEYNRQTMLRMVNHDSVLCQIYLQRCDEYGDAEMALESLFEERIKDSPLVAYHKMWERLSTDNDVIDNKLREDSKLAAEIRKLMNVHGWRVVIGALLEYVENKRREAYNCGFKERSEQWKKIYDNIAQTSRRRPLE